ncbi:MAG: metal-dependent transcriptional regulator [Candidatus Latescibacterota bacterium]|nr:metal-dependent transcriptional regulator [Thermoplasmata archaeon]RKY69355.1 MAG: metal-dependent transcriptional regulator [Candidatus Latescibacterota bacterium]
MGRRAEEYIEIIYDLSRGGERVHVKEVAERLNVSLPSVTEMFQRLAEAGFLNYHRYYGVTLTDKGRKLAEDLEKRHQTLKEFLHLLGLEEEEADREACKIEHVVDPETVKLLTKFVEFIEMHDSPRWLARFRKYYLSGELERCPKIKDGV